MAIRLTRATLYYDGSCPVCRSEMRVLRRLKRADLHLQNIHDLPPTTTLDTETLLRRLHLWRRDGSWAVGLDAAVEAWDYTPVGWLLKPLRWSFSRQRVDSVYNHWADGRYCKRYTVCAAPGGEVG